MPIHLKEAFEKDIDKMLQVGVLKPVTEATPWINSFVLAELKDKSGNLKLRIFLDLTNLNKAIIREPYHFKTPEEYSTSDCRSLHYSSSRLLQRLLASTTR